MSQWLGEHHFRRGDTLIRVLAVSKRTGFEPSADDTPIDKLALVHVIGDTPVALAMLEELKARFVGKPHSEWLAQAIEMPLPIER